LPFQTLALSFEFGEGSGHMASFYLAVYNTVR
jgi:hypothetical protein